MYEFAILLSQQQKIPQDFLVDFWALNMVTKTELMAIEWLKHNRKYKDNEIIRNSITPNFICTDGKRYEVKLLYGKKLLFYQSKQLKPDDTILVFNRKGYVTHFLWKDRDKILFSINIISVNTEWIKVSVDVTNILNKIKRHKENYNDVLKRILKVY